MRRETATATRAGRRLVVRDEFVPNVKQTEFFRACNAPYRDVEEVLFDGSIRAGKTQALGKWFAAQAMKTGGTYVISRFTYRDLEQSTKKAMLYGDGGMPPAIPTHLMRGGSVETAKNETHNKITLVNGAEILFRALEPSERGKIRNITACAWGIDQAEELEPGPNETDEDLADFYQEIKGRCSDPRGPLKLVLVANPGPTAHLLYERFIDPRTCYPKSRRVHVTIHDNRDHIPPHYYDMLMATELTNPAYFRRMVMGEWGVMGGRRFQCFNPRLHVLDHVLDIPASWTIVEGIDYGWANETVVLWAALAHNGRVYIAAEHAAKQMKVSDHAKVIKAVRAGHIDTVVVGEPPQDYNVAALRPFSGQLEPSAIWLDPSAWNRKEGDSVAKNFLKHGIYAARAINDRLGGWNRLEEMFTTTLEDGYPQVQFFPGCEGLIKEIPNLRIKPGTDDVEKVNDHHADALRYIVMSQMPTPEEDEPEVDEHDRASALRLMVKHREERRANAGREHGLYEGG